VIDRISISILAGAVIGFVGWCLLVLAVLLDRVVPVAGFLVAAGIVAVGTFIVDLMVRPRE
jgi:hypothetical protein